MVDFNKSETMLMRIGLCDDNDGEGAGLHCDAIQQNKSNQKLGPSCFFKLLVCAHAKRQQHELLNRCNLAVERKLTH